MTEQEAFAVACLMRCRLVRPRPIVTSSVWITNDWQKLTLLKRALLRSLERSFDAVTVQSMASIDQARDIFPDSLVELMYFGVNPDAFAIRPPSRQTRHETRIFAGGHDKTRDWQTLLRAFGNQPGFTLEIYCRRLPFSQIAGLSNVTLHHAMAIRDFVTAIQHADIAAIPMNANTFSGITFALNAAALGTPILATNTGGVPSYFEPNEVLYCRPGDAADMRCTVLNASVDDRLRIAQLAQKRFQRCDYSSVGLMRRFNDVTRRVLIARDATSAQRPG